LSENGRAVSRRTWWLSFALLVALGAGWALATPIFASPDEPSQTIRAWSVAHGELFGHAIGPHSGLMNPFGTPNVSDYGLSVRAPAAYKNSGGAGCIAFQPRTTANCLSLGHSPRIVQELTYHGRYFPAFFFLVGLPSLFSSPGAWQVYLMRLASVLLVAALLASAIVTIRRSEAPSLAAAGVVLAITPMVLFLGASVNASGLEIAAAIAVWTSGTLLAKTAAGGLDRRLVDRLGIAAVALAIARPLGPLWLAIAAAILAMLAGVSCLRALWRSYRVRVWVGVITGATALHLGWNIWADAYDARHYGGSPSSLSILGILHTSTGKSFELLRQMIGVFGWLETPAPTLTLVIWLFAVGALVGLAVALAPRRWALALGIVVGLTVLLPIVLEGMQARQVGFPWQGRYTLPLAVGVPVLAGFSLSEAPIARLVQRRLAGLLIVGLGLAQVLAFGQALRRYSVGANGTIWFFTQAAWEPPIPGLLLVIGFAVATVLFLCYALLLPRAVRDFAGDTASRARARLQDSPRSVTAEN
jgi:Predicted membrane protein (DUF2142)